MTSPDTSPEAVEQKLLTDLGLRTCLDSLRIDMPATTRDVELHIMALSGELARTRAELVHGICAVANGDMETADALLDKYMPNRPKLPELRQMSLAEVMAVVTGTQGPSHD